MEFRFEFNRSMVPENVLGTEFYICGEKMQKRNNGKKNVLNHFLYFCRVEIKENNFVNTSRLHIARVKNVFNMKFVVPR